MPSVSKHDRHARSSPGRISIFREFGCSSSNQYIFYYDFIQWRVLERIRLLYFRPFPGLLRRSTDVPFPELDRLFMLFAVSQDRMRIVDGEDEAPSQRFALFQGHLTAATQDRNARRCYLQLSI
jgi:hypothetical protein